MTEEGEHSAQIEYLGNDRTDGDIRWGSEADFAVLPDLVDVGVLVLDIEMTARLVIVMVFEDWVQLCRFSSCRLSCNVG